MSSAAIEKNQSTLPEDILERDFKGNEDLLFDVNSGVEDDRGLQLHSVLVGSIGLLLPGNVVSEVVDKAVVCRLPNTHAWFSGVVSSRGNMIPVFDLHKLFSIKSTAEKRRLIVIGENETAVGIWIDGFPRLLKFDDEDLTTSEPAVPSLIREHSRQYFLKDGQTWIDWDIGTFFTALGKLL